VKLRLESWLKSLEVRSTQIGRAHV
jgi:hypothetical protein